MSSRRFVICAILASFGISLAVFPMERAGAAPTRHHGLVPIESSYLDEALGRSFQIEGSMLVFSLRQQSGPNRIFGLTAAHVSQGTHLKIDGNDPVNGEVLGRLSMNRNDLELLELAPGSFKSLGYWNDQKKRIEIPSQGFAQWRGEQSDPAQSIVVMTPGGPGISTFVLKGDWVHAPASSFEQDFSKESQSGFGITRNEWSHLSYLPITGEVYARATLAPGMSGAPLLSLDLQSGSLFDILKSEFSSDGSGSVSYVVHGIAKRAQRGLPGSWFASEKTIRDLFEAYLSGKRGPLDKVRWHLRNRLTYRDFGNGNAEIMPASGPVGNLSRGDGGNLSRGDGGSPGLGFTGWDPDLWKKLEITPGIRYRNQPILGFRLFENIGFYTEDDPTPLIALFKRAGGSDDPAIVSLHADFFALLAAKAVGYLHQERSEDLAALEHLKKGELPLRLATEYFLRELKRRAGRDELMSKGASPTDAQREFPVLSREQFIKQKQQEISLRLSQDDPKQERLLQDLSLRQSFDRSYEFLSDTSNPALRIDQQRMRIENGRMIFDLQGPFPGYDAIHFELDGEGRLLRSGKPTTPFFIPLIRVLSRNGTPFIFDLRSLFFIDTSRIRLSDWDPKVGIPPSPELRFYDLALILMEGPVIRFRLEASPQIYEVQWSRIKN